jgi:hypothetical protein
LVLGIPRQVGLVPYVRVQKGVDSWPTSASYKNEIFNTECRGFCVWSCNIFFHSIIFTITNLILCYVCHICDQWHQCWPFTRMSSDQLLNCGVHHDKIAGQFAPHNEPHANWIQRCPFAHIFVLVISNEIMNFTGKNCFGSHSARFSIVGSFSYHYCWYWQQDSMGSQAYVYQSDEKWLHKMAKLLYIGQN